MSQEEYVLITVAKQNFTWEARILSRGMPYLATLVSLPIRLKSNTRITVGDICLVDMKDADTGVGTGDILELIEPKEIRKLRHKKIIPEEDEYAYLLVSDKKLGYTGGAFPYKAKLSGLGASTLPEDPDVVARTKYAAKLARRAARKAENGGVSPAYSTPSTTPIVGPAQDEGGPGGMAALALPSASSGSTRRTSTHSDITENSKIGQVSLTAVGGSKAPTSGAVQNDDASSSDGHHEAGEDREDEGEGEEEEELVNPNHAKWGQHGGGVSKGYVSKQERRDLELQQRRDKRAVPPPRQSPSLIPQMEALDRVGGDAELDDI